MASLVGKAQDDDDTFWTHSIWSEAGGGFSDKASRKRRRDEDETSLSSGSEGGSGDDDSVSDGEGSYRMSDDESAAAVDQFDSDFDESESDADEDEDGEGDEELELRAEERKSAASKREKNRRLGVPLKASAGRELMRKKTGKMTKRGPLGEGYNEGLVLNWPPSSGGAAAPVGARAGTPAKAPAHTQIVGTKPTTIPIGAQSIPAAASQIKPQHVPSQPIVQPPIFPKNTAIKSQALPRHLRAGPTSPSAKPSFTKLKQQQRQAVTTGERKKIPKRQFTQEEMILESIKSTETENAKWLNSRKRGKEESAQMEKASSAKKSSLNQKPISRFHSRRGRTNTLTFMDMDHLPEILTRRHVPPSRAHPSTSPKRRRLDSTTSETSETTQATTNAEKNHEKCVVTGKVARYRDPKTNLGYHDLDAYKEIRRRVESGEIKISQPARTNGNRRKKSEGLNNGSSSQSSASGVKTTTIPFAPDQPTMVAEIITSTGANVVKVIVTQGGVPVPPPPSRTGLPLKFPGEHASLAEEEVSHGNRKKPPPLLPSVGQNDSNDNIIDKFLMGRMGSGMETTHKQISLADKSQDNRKAPPPLLPSTEQHGSAELQHISLADGSHGNTKVPPQLLPSTGQIIDDSAEIEENLFLMGGLGIDFSMESEHQHMHYVDESNSASGVPKGAVPNESQTAEPALPAKSSQPAIAQPLKLAATGGNNVGGSEAGNDHEKDDDVQPKVAVSNSLDGKEEPNTNGGSKDKSKDPPTKDISRKGTDDNKQKNIVPEVSTSNDKRTTIEAN